MKHIHLLRVVHPPSAFAGLIEALGKLGLRAGWLRFSDPEPETPEPLPADLEAAAATGVMRAVATSGGVSIAVKPRRGPAVLRDVLREHFRGCQVVLVDGAVEAPILEPHGTGWCFLDQNGADEVLTSEALALRLRSPKTLVC